MHQVLDLGTTQLDETTREELLADLSNRYQPQHYNLLKHNCNTFSNEYAELLCGKGAPDWVLNQADEVLSTPMGQVRFFEFRRPRTHLPAPFATPGSNLIPGLPWFPMCADADAGDLADGGAAGQRDGLRLPRPRCGGSGFWRCVEWSGRVRDPPEMIPEMIK